MFSFNKNSYLQSRSGGINPWIINRSVSKARQAQVELTSTVHDLVLDDDHRLASEQPCHPLYNIDGTRRPLAFGRLQVKTLRRELHSADPTMMMAALCSFADILHDPEKAYEAIQCRVPDRLVDLMQHELPEVRERVLMVLTVLIGASGGCTSICKNRLIMDTLKLLIDDVDGAVRYKAAILVERLSMVWMAADELIDYGFIEVLLDCVLKDEPMIARLHFKSLEGMFYSNCGRKIAFDANFLKVLFDYIEAKIEIGDFTVIPSALKCMGYMLEFPEGQKIALDLDLLDVLEELIYHDDPEVYTAAAFVLMFATLKMRSKVNAAQYINLPARLVKLAYNCHNDTTQVYCIKALTNLCEYPPTRLRMYKKYLSEVVAIDARDPDVKKYKDILVDLVMNVSNLEQKFVMSDDNNPVDITQPDDVARSKSLV